MKFRSITNEEFTSITNRDAHYNKHVVKGKQFRCGPEEYEERFLFTSLLYLSSIEEYTMLNCS